jgi:hypothetical protein
LAVRRLTYRLTRSVDATVFVGEGESDHPPKTEAVVIRPRAGGGGAVSVFALRQITAEMLRAEAERDANRDDSDLDALTQGDPWAVLRAQLLDLAFVFPDYAPAEFDTARGSELLELITRTIGKLRDELQTIAQRLAEIDSEAALQYLSPDAATPPATTRPFGQLDLDRLRESLTKRGESKEEKQQIDDFYPVQPASINWMPFARSGLDSANLTFNKRTGLWLHRMDGREIIALPSSDGVHPTWDGLLELFDITRSPKVDADTPDFIIRVMDGGRLEARVKSYSALRRTRATRPRQISAAIAALEARQNGNHVAGRYAVVAGTLGMPPEKPVVVQRLVASVTNLISNPETVALVRFLAPEQVNIDKVITQVLNREKPAIKTRKAEKK